MKIWLLGCHALVLTLSVCSLSSAHYPESPWDCVRRVIDQLQPARPRFENVLSDLRNLLRNRKDVTEVTESAVHGFITIKVSTAEEFRYIDTRFGAKGYQGYPVSPDISPCGEDLTGSQVGERWTQIHLVEYLPEGVERYRRHQRVSFEMLRERSAETKIDDALRAQLASDFFRVVKQWNPERRILLSINPYRLHWHYLAASSFNGGPVPKAEDIDAALPELVEAFIRQYQVEVGMQVIAQRPRRDLLAVQLLVTFPAREGFLRTLRNENVISALPMEYLESP